MKKFWWSIVVIGVLAIAFFLISTCMAVQNNHSLTDEWRSWLPPAQEETIETPEIEDSEDIVVEVENA